jgi:hypothetical protein
MSMGLSHNRAHADERVERAALRQNVLEYARLLGWPSRTVIAFAERAARRPWKRCRSDQLADIVSDLSTIHLGLTRFRGLALLVDTSDGMADRGGPGERHDHRW